MELCYILDDNAYILSDPEAEHAGKFFGEVERKLMQIMIEDKVYEATRVLDYQAVCYEDRETVYPELMKMRSSAINVVFWNPFKSVVAALTTMLTVVQALPSYVSNCRYNFFLLNLCKIFFKSTVMYPDPEYDYDKRIHAEDHCFEVVHDEEFEKCVNNWFSTISFKSFSKVSKDEIYKDCVTSRLKKCREENGTENILMSHLTKTRPIKCDKFNLVYSLTKDESNLQKPYDECNRPFVIHKIPHSNLILLVTNRLCAQVFATEREFYDKPQTIEYVNSTFCRRVKVSQLFRVRPSYCTNYHKMVI